MDIGVLLEVEHQGWESLCRGTGAEFYGSLMTPDGLMVLDGGFMLDRDMVVASLDAAPRWETYRIDDARLVELDADSVALVYTGHAHRSGDGDDAGTDFHAFMSSVYTQRQGHWRLALYQQTPVPDAGH